VKEFILTVFLMNAQDGTILDSWPAPDHPVYQTIEECLQASVGLNSVTVGGKVFAYGCRTTNVAPKGPTTTL
jgi:GH43 family beta-xylosidase